MTYTVRYKKINSLFWRSLKRVKGDGFIEGGPLQAGPNGQVIGPANLPIRWFILEDETRVEIPAMGYLFRFSPQRFMNIKKRMEAEAGQPIATR